MNPETKAEVVVTVGTDHHPFNRLVRWVDEWRDEHQDVSVIVQRGTSNESRHGGSRELVPYDELCQLFTQATVVVGHGGPATVMDALGAGRLPIVVPRDPTLGEHVDAHQMRFAHHLEHSGLAVVATTKEGLFDALDRARANPADFAASVASDVSEGVTRFAEVVDDMLSESPRRAMEANRGIFR